MGFRTVSSVSKIGVAYLTTLKGCKMRRVLLGGEQNFQNVGVNKEDQIKSGQLNSSTRYDYTLAALINRDLLHFYLCIVYFTIAITKRYIIFKYSILFLLCFSSWTKLMIFYINPIFVLSLDTWFVVLCDTYFAFWYFILYDINIISIIYCQFLGSM